MEYLIRFSQSLETFRLAEMRALARSEGIDMEVVWYDADVSWPTRPCACVVLFPGGQFRVRSVGG